ncbi:MAG: aminotransferase class V-fold PLP-dependent enzyme, partial [Planctomycetales bacterium]
GEGDRRRREGDPQRARDHLQREPRLVRGAQERHPQEVAAMLDTGYGIEVRAGYHCAADIHAPIGSLENGGTVRLSVGPFNSSEDIAAAVAAVADIAVTNQQS